MAWPPSGLALERRGEETFSPMAMVTRGGLWSQEGGPGRDPEDQQSTEGRAVQADGCGRASACVLIGRVSGSSDFLHRWTRVAVTNSPEPPPARYPSCLILPQVNEDV